MVEWCFYGKSTNQGFGKSQPEGSSFLPEVKSYSMIDAQYWSACTMINQAFAWCCTLRGLQLQGPCLSAPIPLLHARLEAEDSVAR